MALAFVEHTGGIHVLELLILVFLENVNVEMVLPVQERLKYVKMDHVNVCILTAIHNRIAKCRNLLFSILLIILSVIFLIKIRFLHQ